MHSHSSDWSRIPPEIGHEIAAQNADDVSSLCAMCLVSKKTRSLAIPHLFSTIKFTHSEDFSQWLDMLGRTPSLANVVKTVNFFDHDELTGRSDLTKHLYQAAIPPVIPYMPSVRTIRWNAGVSVEMMVAYLSLFPNAKELHIYGVSLESFHSLIRILSACGDLKILSFTMTYVEHSHSDSERNLASGTRRLRIPRRFNRRVSTTSTQIFVFWWFVRHHELRPIYPGETVTTWSSVGR
ncbi:hypothetical protein C8R43DRAFT_492833 [Mycena crocata]|nr:hypothetical protein C8R43DRAFT_492833 [Mycena crocata]